MLLLMLIITCCYVLIAIDPFYPKNISLSEIYPHILKCLAYLIKKPYTKILLVYRVCYNVRIVSIDTVSIIICKAYFTFEPIWYRVTRHLVFNITYINIAYYICKH